MGDIYADAQAAYVWLGEGTEQSDRALAPLNRTGLLYFWSPSGLSFVWAAIKSLITTPRCNKHDRFVCTGMLTAQRLLHPLAGL
jgi:hypothetical protein